MGITLYTTHCPKCMVLETKLKQKGLNFQEETSIEKMEALGMLSAPMLQVDDKLLSFKEANEWINKQ